VVECALMNRFANVLNDIEIPLKCAVALLPQSFAELQRCRITDTTARVRAAVLQGTWEEFQISPRNSSPNSWCVHRQNLKCFYTRIKLFHCCRYSCLLNNGNCNCLIHFETTCICKTVIFKLFLWLEMWSRAVREFIN